MTAAGMCERTGKRRFTRKEAMRQAAWWRVRRFARMAHYKCKHCGNWHIGNKR